MGTTLIQTRVDTSLKNDVSRLFNDLGLDISTAIKMFFKKCIQMNGIPFDVRIARSEYVSQQGMNAFLELRRQAEENGVSGMSLDEINAEITAARADRKKRRIA